jgi:hypothetical protein
MNESGSVLECGAAVRSLGRAFLACLPAADCTCIPKAAEDGRTTKRRRRGTRLSQPWEFALLVSGGDAHLEQHALPEISPSPRWRIVENERKMPAQEDERVMDDTFFALCFDRPDGAPLLTSALREAPKLMHLATMRFLSSQIFLQLPFSPPWLRTTTTSLKSSSKPA